MIFYVIVGDFLVGTGEPPPYCNIKITLLYGCGFGLKKLGFGQTPTHLIGRKSQLLLKFFLETPLIIYTNNETFTLSDAQQTQAIESET